MEEQNQTVQTIEQPKDPFSLDETAFVSLSPEQRASIEPVLDTWKKKANEEIQRRESSVSEKYKPYEEKATALDKLVNYAPFQNWWNEQQKSAANQNPQAGAAINQTKPQDIASNQEWQEAIWEASQGNSQKITELQNRMTAAWASPLVQQISQKQQNIEIQMELRDLFERFPDAKELDKIGLDDKKQGVSLLEMGLDWAERNRQPLQKGYELAKTWADSLKVQAQQTAMGMVNEKKRDVTAGPSTSTGNKSIVEVANSDELLKRSLEATMSGNNDVRFVIRGR